VPERDRRWRSPDPGSEAIEMEDGELEKVKRRIAAVRDRREVRWTMSSRTAELAILAFGGAGDERRSPIAGKPRRRRRFKKLL
jgi:hypothetical protein